MTYTITSLRLKWFLDAKTYDQSFYFNLFDDMPLLQIVKSIIHFWNTIMKMGKLEEH